MHHNLSWIKKPVKTLHHAVMHLIIFDIECKSAAKAELQIWHADLKEKEVVPDSPQSSLLYAKPMIFPNIRKMLIHIMVLPVTSCEAEWSFSTLHRIKSYLCITMTNERLNGLALLSVYNETSYIYQQQQN